MDDISNASDRASTFPWLDRLSAFVSPAFRAGTLPLADQAVVSGASFLSTVIVGRACGADGLGAYALGFTLVVLICCGQESLLSTPYTIYRRRIESQAGSVYAGSLFLHFVLLAAIASLGLGIAAAGLGLLPRWGELSQILWVLVGAMPLILLRDLVRRIGFAHLRFNKVLIVDAAAATIQLGVLVALAATGTLSAPRAYVVMGLSCAVAVGVWFALARIPMTFRRDMVADHLRKNLRLGRWVFAAIVALMLQLSVAQWLVAGLLGVAETGVFVACLTVVMLISPFVQGVSNALVPRTALALANGGRRELRRVVRKTTELLAPAMAAFCLVVVLLGEKLVSILYGAEFVGHRNVLILLALAVMARTLSMPPYNGLQAADRADRTFWANLLGLGVTTTLVCGLAPTLGIVGAAWGLLAGDLAAAAARWGAYWHSLSGEHG